MKSLATYLNTKCSCKTLDSDLLLSHIDVDLIQSRPNLFSSTMVFISQDQYAAIKDLIAATEEIINSSNFRESILHDAPDSARVNHGPSGVFMGYDFHISSEGPRLIEINTNAGGALLNAELARAQNACCFKLNSDSDIQKRFFEMFLKEWKLQKGDSILKRIAIVDKNPAEQYLYPEFKLFQKLFSENGVDAIIADPKDLAWTDGKLMINNAVIDLVYNRTTDFYFEEIQNHDLKEAYLADAVVVTPNPYHHALYANKFNLTLLTDADEMDRLQIPLPLQKIVLSHIPRTEKLCKESAEDFWERRRNLFFKPNAGFGSRAAYRGDKITRKVWENILQEEYVAQEIIPPSQRIVEVDNKITDLKIDIRAYVYEGQIQLLAARLYSGQTTNFRTAGGGFAPVTVTPENS